MNMGNPHAFPVAPHFAMGELIIPFPRPPVDVMMANLKFLIDADRPQATQPTGKSEFRGMTPPSQGLCKGPAPPPYRPCKGPAPPACRPCKGPAPPACRPCKGPAPPAYRPLSKKAREHCRAMARRGPPPPYKPPMVVPKPKCKDRERFRPSLVGIPEQQVFHSVPGKWGRGGA